MSDGTGKVGDLTLSQSTRYASSGETILMLLRLTSPTSTLSLCRLPIVLRIVTASCTRSARLQPAKHLSSGPSSPKPFASGIRQPAKKPLEKSMRCGAHTPLRRIGREARRRTFASRRARALVGMVDLGDHARCLRRKPMPSPPLAEPYGRACGSCRIRHRRRRPRRAPCRCPPGRSSRSITLVQTGKAALRAGAAFSTAGTAGLETTFETDSFSGRDASRTSPGAACGDGARDRPSCRAEPPRTRRDGRGSLVRTDGKNRSYSAET